MTAITTPVGPSINKELCTSHHDVLTSTYLASVKPDFPAWMKRVKQVYLIENILVLKDLNGKSYFQVDPMLQLQLFSSYNQKKEEDYRGFAKAIVDSYVSSCVQLELTFGIAHDIVKKHPQLIMQEHRLMMLDDGYLIKRGVGDFIGLLFEKNGKVFQVVNAFFAEDEKDASVFVIKFLPISKEPSEDIPKLENFTSELATQIKSVRSKIAEAVSITGSCTLKPEMVQRVLDGLGIDKARQPLAYRFSARILTAFSQDYSPAEVVQPEAVENKSDGKANA